MATRVSSLHKHGGRCGELNKVRIESHVWGMIYERMIQTPQLQSDDDNVRELFTASPARRTYTLDRRILIKFWPCWYSPTLLYHSSLPFSHSTRRVCIPRNFILVRRRPTALTKHNRVFFSVQRYLTIEFSSLQFDRSENSQRYSTLGEAWSRNSRMNRSRIEYSTREKI